MSVVKGNLKPIKDNILITDMNFDEQRTASGIVVLSDDGKSEGIKPRWGRVWAVGPEQHDVEIGDWILIEHGRWTRSAQIEREDGEIIKIRRVDTKCIIMKSKEEPQNEITVGITSAQHGSIFDPSDFTAPMYEGQRG